jgi:hypothetical protein
MIKNHEREKQRQSDREYVSFSEQKDFGSVDLHIATFNLFGGGGPHDDQHLLWSVVFD